MATNNMGIPDVRRRVDDSESARQWNRMRDGLYSLHNSAEPFSTVRPFQEAWGFAPISLHYHQDPESLEENEAGVGISLGRLHFLQTARPTTVAADQKSVEVIPTIDGTALNATVKPRQALSDGDHEAWVVYRELGSTHEAKIVFATLDAGPGTLDRDEKAVRLCTFKVTNNTSNTEKGPRVVLYDQIVRDNLSVPIERHPFRVYKTASNKVKVEEGNLIWLKGPGANVVSETVNIPESSELTISSNGSIWAYAYYYTAQHSQGYAYYNYIYWRNYRLDSLTGVGTQWLASAPTRGTDTTNIYSQGYLYYEIAKVEVSGGEVFVTDQIVNGPIYLNELSDTHIQ